MPATTFLLPLLASNAIAATVELPRYPAASPDGTSVVFSWRGDLWRAPAAGGEAVRLTTNPGDDLRSIFTRDGTMLVFESSREGARNIWAMPAGGGEPRQLTFGDSPVLLGGLGTGADGKPVVMVDSSREGDLYRAMRPYQVSIEGGPLARVHDAFGTRPTANANGVVLFERGGNSWPVAATTAPMHAMYGPTRQASLPSRPSSDSPAGWATTARGSGWATTPTCTSPTVTAR